MLDQGDDDPFAIFLTPPRNESNAERVAREIRVAEAKKRSENIDQEIVGERERLMSAEKLHARVALLGGTESGKSEMIKKIASSQKSGIENDRQRVLLRLAPLRRVEQNLQKWLSTSAEETAHLAGKKEWVKEHEDAVMMISMCREDIKTVWMDKKVQVSLREGKIQLEESAEFFLEEVDRVASRNYIPSDEDAARVRSRPVVQEYWINVGQCVDYLPEKEWCLYDISRPRISRDVWIPYFEGLRAIMFFFDLSGFNSPLSEGSKVTQLEDSVILWRTICESPLLQKASLILFLTRASEMMDLGDDDPLAIFLRPPKNESNAERVAREIREAEAKKRSEDIDQEIVEERERLMRAEEFQTREVRNDQDLEDLQIHYGREEWTAELARWRCVIQLKLVKSVIIILDALEAEGRGERPAAIEELRQLVLL
ncbi:hypothetical protein H1R20_g10731, partial [Candolleomyces eurysporus]